MSMLSAPKDYPERSFVFLMARRLLAAVGLCLVTVGTPPLIGTAEADVDNLQRFFTDVQSYTAQFNQVVLDESLNILQESSGTMWIERPNKFRWDYDVPFEQHIVGDGQKIWVYDVELQQVTVRNLSGGLGATPAMLLAGRGRLDDDFIVKSLGAQGKLQWAQLVPRTNDGGFEDIRVGFEKGKIRILEMIDGFGQTTRIILRNSGENIDIGSVKFAFEPPPGVDIVRERPSRR